MTTDRKKPAVAFWATVVVAVLIAAYPLAWPLARWLIGRDDVPNLIALPLIDIYEPLWWLYENGPEWLRGAFDRYFALWGME